MKNESYARHVTHGLTGTRVYKTWESMKARCYNKNDAKYPSYGGRGIKVCEEWLGKDGAGNFANWAYKNGFDESKRQAEQSLDRIDVDGDYCPENCRLVDARVQANNKQNTVWLEYNGERLPLQTWAERTGIKEGTIRWRINNGYTVKQALESKVKSPERTGKHFVEYKGETKSIAEWSKIVGIPEKNLYSRFSRGWTIERAFETPVGADKWHKTK